MSGLLVEQPEDIREAERKAEEVSRNKKEEIIRQKIDEIIKREENALPDNENSENDYDDENID